MAASLRRLAGPLSSTAAAVVQEGRAALGSGGGGGGIGDVARRAVTSALRQLQNTVFGCRSQMQTTAAGPVQQQQAGASRTAGAGAARQYSSQQPGPQQQPAGRSTASGAGAPASGGDGAPRAKPRFLLERLGRAEAGAAGGGAGGRGSGASGPSARPHQRSAPPGTGGGPSHGGGPRPQWQDRSGGPRQQQQQPWQDRSGGGGGAGGSAGGPGSGPRQPWQDRSASGGGPRPWQDRSGGSGGTRPWQDRSGGGGPGGSAPGTSGGPRPWQDRSGSSGGPRPWQDRSNGGGGGGGGGGPGSGARQPWQDRSGGSGQHAGSGPPGSQQGQQQGQYPRPPHQGQQQGQYPRPQQQGQYPRPPQQGQYPRPQQQGQQQRPQQWGQQPRQQQPGGAVNGFVRRGQEGTAAAGAAPQPQQQHERFPRQAGGGQQQEGQQPQRPPFETFFPAELPTEFPSAFPRAQQQAGKQQGKGKGSFSAAPSWKKANKAAQQAQQQVASDLPQEVVIPEDVTVLRLAQLLDVPLDRVEAVLSELGEDVSSRHDLVPPDAAELAAMEFGKIAILSSRGGRGAPLDADAVPRPAVVTVMGHVDHGKTTLLDALRRTSVAAGEAGGITQHIGAFEVQMPGSKQSLTFLDTPGHAAFSSMRARGAAVTDLVVLVVAADDGIMPQTREAISHARAAGCPIVVAITKCDAAMAQPARVRQQLLVEGLELEEVGGNIQVVEVAAVTGQGLDLLEESLLLQAEMMELKASRSRRAEAVVIEAKVDKGQGPVATVVVKRGTLKVGQPMVVGTEWGRVRSMKGTGGKAITEVLPGQPAEIAGLKGLPQAGDQVLVVDSEERAQVISKARTSNSEYHRRAAIARMIASEQTQRDATAATALNGSSSGSGNVGAVAEGAEVLQRTLPLIIKADVQGSAEAVQQAVQHLCTEHVRVQIVHVGVGPVSQSDVQLAVPLGAKILGFNVRTAGADVDGQAKMHGVEVRCQRVIYGLLEDVSSLLVGASPKVEHEVVAGTAEVLQVFPLKGSRGKDAGIVAGCRVSEGSIKGSLRYRVMRAGEAVHTGPCASLKRHKLEVETVGKGTECGVLLEGFDDVRPGDVLQCITVEMRASDKVTSSQEARKWGPGER